MKASGRGRRAPLRKSEWKPREGSGSNSERRSRNKFTKVGPIKAANGNGEAGRTGAGQSGGIRDERINPSSVIPSLRRHRVVIPRVAVLGSSFKRIRNPSLRRPRHFFLPRDTRLRTGASPTENRRCCRSLALQITRRYYRLWNLSEAD